MTTAALDRLEFQAPAYVNDTIVLEGRITYVGRTSMRFAWTRLWKRWAVRAAR